MTDRLEQAARAFLAKAASRKLLFVTAESCTGGLIAATICKVPGCSSVFERGFITYSNRAKTEMLGVHPDIIAANGAVSAEVAIAMAEGALDHSNTHIAVAVTGIAGPDGGSDTKPIGLVHIAAVSAGGRILHEEKRFGDIGRQEVQEATVAAAFVLLDRLLN